MSRYRSVPEPRMYLFAVVLAALAVLLVYVQIAIFIPLARKVLLVLSVLLFLVMLILLLVSEYNYVLKDDKLLITYSVPIPHRRYHLGYLKSIIELSMLETEKLESRVEELRRSSGGKLRDHSYGDLVDCVVLFFKDGKKVDLVLLSPKRKDIFLLDLRRLTLGGITMTGEMSYHELINELLKNDYRI
jgi:hypothetical protein